MKPWTRGGLAALAAGALLLAQDDAPPPAIAQDGVVNAASLMPPQFGAGAIAPGARVLIHGWRLGPAQPVRAPQGTTSPELAGISVAIRSGSARTRLALESVSANLIEATLPLDAPAGPGQLIVSHGEDASLPAPVKVAATAFGAYTLNDLGWGPAKFAKEGSVPNPARPGQTVTLFGTGMGLQRQGAIPVLAGRQAGQRGGEPECGGSGSTHVRAALRCSGGLLRAGAGDRAAPGVASNVVTIAVSRGAGPAAIPAIGCGSSSAKSTGPAC